MSSVQIKYSTSADLSGATTTSAVATDSSTDFTGAIDLTGLTAGTQYYYTILVDGVDQLTAPYPTLKTFPTAGSPAKFSLAFGACTMHDNVGDDTIFAAIPSGTNFFLHLGDTVYADRDDPIASTLTDYRTQHRNAMMGTILGTAHWAALRRSMPVFTMWDDHDLYNNFNAGTGDPQYAPALKAFQEYHARANPDSMTSDALYYAFQVGNVGFFVPDERSFRTAETGTDNSSKVFLGATQTAALKAWLLDNNDTLTLKFICSEVPASGYAWNTGSDSWGGVYDSTQAPNGANGYRTDRNALWDFIDANQITGVVFLAGDQHWAGSFKTMYGASVERPRYEFLSTPLNMWNNATYMLNYVPLAADPVNGPVLWKADNLYNVGVVNIDTTVTPATVSFQLYGTGGSLGSSYLTSITQDDIDTGLVPSGAMTFTGTLPNATEGTSWTGVMYLGGTYTTPVEIGASSGTIPTWMGDPTIDYGAGTVTWSGTPASGDVGTDSFTPTATDSSGTPQVVDGPAQSVVVSAVPSGDITPIGGTTFHNPAGSVSLPSGCTAGDFVLIGLNCTSSNTTTAPAGATRNLATTNFYTGSTGNNIEQWGYFLNSTDITNGTIALTTSHAFGAIYVYSGVNATTPFAQTGSVGQQGLQGMPAAITAPSVSFSSSQAVVFMGCVTDTYGGTAEFSAPTGYIKDIDVLTSNIYLLTMSHMIATTSGNTGSVSSSFTGVGGSPNASAAVQTVLNPA